MWKILLVLCALSCHILVSAASSAELEIALEIPAQSSPSPKARSPKRQRSPLISDISCERICKDAIIKVGWANRTSVEGPYSLEVHYDTEDGMKVSLQTTRGFEYEDGVCQFKANGRWKAECQREVFLSIRSSTQTVCTSSPVTLVTICPNFIQRGDKNPDDTDMMFATIRQPLNLSI